MKVSDLGISPISKISRVKEDTTREINRRYEEHQERIEESRKRGNYMKQWLPEARFLREEEFDGIDEEELELYESVSASVMKAFHNNEEECIINSVIPCEIAEELRDLGYIVQFDYNHTVIKI